MMQRTNASAVCLCLPFPERLRRTEFSNKEEIERVKRHAPPLTPQVPFGMGRFV
jgi:hypothetical protein